jgi:hypothetical protein
MAITDALLQQALSGSPTFKARVKSALATVAWQVLNNGGSSAKSLAYAQAALLNLDAYAGQISGWLVTRTNVTGSNLTLSAATGAAVINTDATDASLQSQLSTDWVALAGG